MVIDVSVKGHFFIISCLAKVFSFSSLFVASMEADVHVTTCTSPCGFLQVLAAFSHIFSKSTKMVTLIDYLMTNSR